MRLGLVSLVLLGGCEGPAPCPDLSDFAILEPAGAAELVPGTEGVRVSWTPVDQSFAIETFDGAIAGPGVPVNAFESEGLISVGFEGVEVTPIGVFHLRARFSCGDPPDDLVEAGPTQLVFVQGAIIPSNPLSFDGTQAERDIVVRTVSLSTMEVELLLDAAGPLDPASISLGRTSVPGEFVAMNRQIPFTGMDANGTAVPAGTYNVWARVHARGGGIIYDRQGPTLTWTP